MGPVDPATTSQLTATIVDKLQPTHPDSPPLTAQRGALGRQGGPNRPDHHRKDHLVPSKWAKEHTPDLVLSLFWAMAGAKVVPEHAGSVGVRDSPGNTWDVRLCHGHEAHQGIAQHPEPTWRGAQSRVLSRWGTAWRH